MNQSIDKTACPSDEVLVEVLLGKYEKPDLQVLEDHFQTCEACVERASMLQPDDSLSTIFKATSSTNDPFTETIEERVAMSQIIERSKQAVSQLETLHSGIDTTQNGQTKPRDADLSEIELDFLAPAQQSDELGRLGDYRILKILGKGGMGLVFSAEDVRLKRSVALKVMLPSVANDRGAKDRFIREAQAAAAIEHDNIISIYQVGEDRGVPFIAMPLLKGQSLKVRLERLGKLPQHEVVKIGCQVAMGLAAAHDRNLIHRDIKPDNIWLESKTGRIKILDFGLVRATVEDSGLTQSGMVLGTPRYMAPEQALGEEVDARSDLFSLGSVLYHLLTGKPAFEGPSLGATWLRLYIKSLSRLNPWCQASIKNW